jgi:hypothetical protein
MLMALLYVGITRWDWLGLPTVSDVSVASPMPIENPGSGVGVNSSPPTGLPSASTLRSAAS